MRKPGKPLQQKSFPPERTRYMDQKQEIQRILDTVLEIYSRLGIKSVTMEDISRHMGLSKKTLYQFFRDKNELVRRVTDREIEQAGTVLDEIYRSDVNAIEELIRMNRFVHSQVGRHSATFFYDLRKYYPVVCREWMERKRGRMYDMVMRNLARGKEQGLYRGEIDAHVIARLYMAIMEMLHNSELFDIEEFQSARFFREVFLYHLHGICNARGLEYLDKQMERI